MSCRKITASIARILRYMIFINLTSNRCDVEIHRKVVRKAHVHNGDISHKVFVRTAGHVYMTRSTDIGVGRIHLHLTTELKITT